MLWWRKCTKTGRSMPPRHGVLVPFLGWIGGILSFLRWEIPGYFRVRKCTPLPKNESYVRLWCRVILLLNWKTCFGKCPDIIFQPAMFDETHIFLHVRICCW